MSVEGGDGFLTAGGGWLNCSWLGRGHI
jgi:hypothetical protein